MKKIFAFFVFGMAMTAMVSFAQDAGGKGEKEGKRPAPPLMSALDANDDGVIDAKEIAGSADALKKLDKNADGKLEGDEIRPARPEGLEGPKRREGGKKEGGKKAEKADAAAGK
ncbi:MAG: hypothetical protein WC637_02405 [Victivallales bacterium]|jgi:hypothetical protein